MAGVDVPTIVAARTIMITSFLKSQLRKRRAYRGVGVQKWVGNVSRLSLALPLESGIEQHQKHDIHRGGHRQCPQKGKGVGGKPQSLHLPVGR